MLLPRRLIAAAFAVAAAAGCSVPAATEPVVTAGTLREPVGAHTKPDTSAPPSTASTFVPAVSPAKLSSACPFLDIAEYQRTFDVYQDLVTKEEPPDHSNGITSYTCDFLFTSSHSTASAYLYVFATGETSVKASLEVSARSCSAKPHYLGDNAYYCIDAANNSDGTDLVVTKLSHRQMRIAIVSSGVPLDVDHPDGYATLAKTLFDRL
ncbi:hypothetical protein AB0383_45005 [Amycolatopsis sp. NPDC051373]|uniref:hypothetical protein n=1 Tax=Amycolatopsis sp. NPDC051373 TaxID=3155801 RepID=UPI00344FA38A